MCRLCCLLSGEGHAARCHSKLAVVNGLVWDAQVRAPCAGEVTALAALAGAQVDDGHMLAVIVPSALSRAAAAA